MRAQHRRESLPPTASKGSGLGTICLWSWSQTWLHRGSKSSVTVVVLAQLQWSHTELAYFSLSTCPGECACPVSTSQAPPLSHPKLSAVHRRPRHCALRG